MANDLSPVRKQYLEIKRQHPEAIVFFRLGDFYETFDQDAELVAAELDIVLTSRNVAKGMRVPMAGIPHHALESYLGRLIEKGHRVAICDQVGDSAVRGLFPREVVRVVTPGTLVEPGLLPGDANNFLAAVIVEGDRVGVAYTDITTGEFAATQLQTADPLAAIRLEITRLSPAEVLAPASLTLPAGIPGQVTRLPDWQFELQRTSDVLHDQLRAASLEGFGLGEMPAAARAAGAIVGYLRSTQPASLHLLTSLSTYALDEFMMLDAATRRNLELMETLRTGSVKGSVLGVVDATVTPMGRRRLQSWISRPLLDVQRIEGRLDQVQAFVVDGLLREACRAALAAFPDVERLTNRTASGLAGPRDLVGLRSVLRRLPDVQRVLASHPSGPLAQLEQAIDPCHDLLGLLERALSDEPPATLAHPGVIRHGFSEKLDAIVDASRGAREWISNLESVERQRTGIKSLKVGYNKVFGYYIEVSNANAAAVPPDYIRKQTLVNGERYITPEMKEYETIVLTAEERIRQTESELFDEVCHSIGTESSRLIRTARALGRLDVTAALAETASRHNYVRPEFVLEGFAILEGRHPVVEQALGPQRFVPNDCAFEPGERLRVITGPNMSGKSTYLRQVALIVLMAQIGSFVPARAASVAITDRIFTRIGAQDEIQAGQSTFMVEMVETANILHHATPRSLVILDEIGRGTSTYDGMSIAWAVLEYLHNHPRLRARTLFATHFHELTRLAEMLPGVRNYNIAVSEEAGQVVFLHRILPGGADKSYGIHVAELAGLPRPVINRAQEILAQLEAESAQQAGAESASVTGKQLPLFAEPDPIREELRGLDVSSMTPLEALNKLFAWRQALDREPGSD
ncbi:MAG: DNA mismatch repair protein MutS [Anaerolineales bacterium]|nr:DNA mismatch repair protein MutS [Anaerolineales bacterium]